MGTGARELPEAARACLAKLSEQRNGSHWRIIRELSNGQLNRCWLVEIDNVPLVVRLGNAEDGSLGVDRHRELTVHTAAAEAGLAPFVEYADPGNGLLVTRFIDGSPCQACEPEQVENLVRSLRRLHGLPLNVPVRDLSAHLDAYHVRLESKPGPALDTAIGYRQRLTPLFEEYARLPAIHRLCHCDPIAENTLVVDGSLVLIDWEYAAGGDPFFDLAVVIEEYAVPIERIDVLLAVYDATARGAGRRLHLLRLWYRLLALYWYAQLTLNKTAAAESVETGLHEQAQALENLLRME